MTAVVLWKEYRQQRAVWIAIALLAVLLPAILIPALGNETGWRVSETNPVRWILAILLFGLVVTYGIVSGALLLAGEKEDGTLPFLDNLSGRRAPIWWSKLWAGVLFSLTQGLALAVLALILGIVTWRQATALPVVALYGLAWGLLAGSLCRGVLSAVIVGIVGMGLTCGVGAGIPVLAFVLVAELAAAITGATIALCYFAWRFVLGPLSSRPGRVAQLARHLATLVTLTLAMAPLCLVLFSNQIAFAEAHQQVSAEKYLELVFGISQGGLALAAGYISLRIFCRDDRARSRRLNQPSVLMPVVAMVAVCMLAFWAESPFVLNIFFVAVAVGMALTANYVGSVLYRRRGPGTVTARVLSPTGSYTGPAVFWLAFRQGRWLLVLFLATVLVAPFVTRTYALLVYPAVTLLLGLGCGLACFCPDQAEANRFLGSQRIPYGHFWTGKTLFWGAALAIFMWMLSFLVVRIWTAVGLPPLPDWNMHSQYLKPQSDNGAGRILSDMNPFTFLALIALYGFGFGQLFGLLARRNVIALIIATTLAPVALGLWLPSLLVGGLPIWQAALVPAALLVISRLSVRPWVAGRIFTRPVIGSLGGCATLLILGQVGFFYYRAIQVPDVGTPFDVSAFLASFPTPEQNEAGSLYHLAVRDLHALKGRLAEQLEEEGGPKGREFPASPESLLFEFNAPWSSGQSSRDPRLEGWFEEKHTLGRWLDLMTRGKWVEEAERAARLPLGVVFDPRVLGSNIARNDEQVYQPIVILTARSLQLQKRGEMRAALETLDTATGLINQVRNFAPAGIAQYASHLEVGTFFAWSAWLAHGGQNKELLHAALASLQRQETTLPDPKNNVKSQYLVEQKEPRLWWVASESLAHLIVRSCLEAPWEKERLRRLMNAETLGQLDAMQPSFWVASSARVMAPFRHGDFFRAMIALPPTSGPGSQLTSTKWAELIQQNPVTAGSPIVAWNSYAGTLSQLRALQLVVAVALYQADRGTLPGQLDELVPKYLAALPENPTTGRGYSYLILSRNEDLRASHRMTVNETPVSIGQALIELPAMFDEKHTWVFPVPMRKLR